MRITPIDRDDAQGKARELLDELAARGGEPGPMIRGWPTPRRYCAATSTSTAR
jgi:hypothetical protein